MEKEIYKKLIEHGEIIHNDYFGVIQLDSDRYLVYWVSQRDIDELNARLDEDPARILINVATMQDGEITIPNAVLEYIPTTYKYVKNNIQIKEIDDFADDFKEL